MEQVGNKLMTLYCYSPHVGTNNLLSVNDEKWSISSYTNEWNIPDMIKGITNNASCMSQMNGI